MYQIGKTSKNRKTIGVEIYRKVENPEVPDLVETEVIFTSVSIPVGWEISRVWKPEEEEEF